MLSIISRLTMTIPELEEYHWAQRKKGLSREKCQRKFVFERYVIRYLDCF